MEDLIETINQLQDVFSITGSQTIDLPQIVVVGTQSSGKSSVLEHLVGKSFLPRGSGIVTRCPLVLQLVQIQGKTEVSVNEYAIFQHDQTKVFTDYKLICKEIENQTERLAGNNKNICNTSINLKIFSTSVLNLTLVDLPGLTKVPVGDQPADIEKQTKDLILEYVKNPNSIILAVTPANADMATSESLKISRDVDPKGTRTLAVITKLDLMDEGTDARDMLCGRVIPVKLGIVGVVNRSQKDIMDGKSVKKSLKDEAAFLNTKYRDLAPYHGSPYLTKTIQSILIKHIKDCLPKLKESITLKLGSKRSELMLLGDTILDNHTLLLELMTKFCNTFCSAIKGNLDNIETNELNGGARINYVFHESLFNTLKSIDALEGLSKAAILTAIQNASGASPTLFVPELAFELLIKKQIKSLRTPSLLCVDLIHNELCRIVQNCMEDPEVGLQRYPILQKEVLEVTTELLSSRISITREMVQHFIDVHLAYINTSHPDFLPNSSKEISLPKVQEGKSNQSFVNLNEFSTSSLVTDSEPLTLLNLRGQNLDSDKGNRDCALIEKLIKSYFSIVRKNIQDVVPKVIMHFMVNHVIAKIQSELVSKLYKSDVSNVLQESRAITDKRKKLKTEITALQKASNILNMLKPSMPDLKDFPPLKVT